MNAEKDPLFKDSKGDSNLGFARLCYMIKSIKGNSKLTPMDIKFTIQNQLSSADFFILKETATNLTDYGLRAGGKTVCPKCGSKDAAYIALVDDRFFRPTVGDLRSWKADRNAKRDGGSNTGTGENGGRVQNLPTNATAKV